MTPSARLTALIELADALIAEWQRENPRPAEQLLKAYTASRRYIGGGDRRALQEALFTLLRDWGRCKAAAEAAGLSYDGRSIALMHLPAQECESLCTGAGYAPASLTQDERNALQSEQGEARSVGVTGGGISPLQNQFPAWFEERIAAEYGAEAPALLAALNQPATLDIRVNAARISRPQAIAALAQEGIAATAIEGLEYGLEAPARAAISQTQAYKNGLIEVQDRGSQQIVEWLCEHLSHWERSAKAKPETGEGENDPHPKAAAHLSTSPDGRGDRPLKLLDYCAGAGGKSLALAAMLGDRVEIDVWDADPKRLAELWPRAARAGYGKDSGFGIRDSGLSHSPLGTEFQTAQGAAAIAVGVAGGGISPLYNMVLLDVPCSGTGTLRRHPDLIWRLTPEKLLTYQRLQREILEKTAAYVAPGGWLCYVTCSLLESENIQTINDFLTHHSYFKVVSSGQMWNKENASDAMMLRRLPHRHHSDGFFAAMLQRLS